MAPPAPSLTLYVDVVSPFGYIAFHAFENDPAFKNVDKTYVPIFLGGLMQACNNTPPINIKNKDKWIDSERLRWAKLFHVPMAEAMPSGFPPMTLGAMRALCAATLTDAGEPDGNKGRTQERLKTALNALWQELFVRHGDVSKPAVFEPVLAAAWGREETQKVLSRANSPATKAALKANTDEAFASGAFGIPWVVCTNAAGRREGFWGVDHLGQIAQFLGLERPAGEGSRALL